MAPTITGALMIEHEQLPRPTTVGLRPATGSAVPAAPPATAGPWTAGGTPAAPYRRLGHVQRWLRRLATVYPLAKAPSCGIAFGSGYRDMHEVVRTATRVS